MRQGGARAGSDDGIEGHAFGAGLAGGELELGGYRRLRDSRAEGFEYGLEQAGAQVHGSTQEFGLPSILDHALALNDAGGRPRTPGPWQERAEAGLRRYSHVVAFNPELSCSLTLEPLDCGRQRWLLSDQDSRAEDFLVRLLRVAAIREKYRLAAAYE